MCNFTPRGPAGKARLHSDTHDSLNKKKKVYMENGFEHPL